MPSSTLSNKIKGMLFADRLGVISRSGTTCTRPEDSQTNLVTEVAGPSSEMTSQDDVRYRGSSRSRRKGRNEKNKFHTRSNSERYRPNEKQRSPSSLTRQSSDRSHKASAEGSGITGHRSKGPLRGLRQQQLLREHRSEYNSSQQVHVWEPGQDGPIVPLVPVKHYMRSSNNTPLRKAGRFDSVRVEDDMRILLNVGGVRHETHVSTLRHIPDSRLSRLAEYHLDSGKGKQEYFFDRHPAVFNSIIDFYRTGELHVPLEVCGAVVKRELDFWQIDELGTKACCYRHYRSYIENQHILDSFKHSLDQETMNADLSGLQGWKLWQTTIWYIMDHPRTSRLAMAYGITSFLFVTASIAGFCLETLPEFKPQAVNTNVTCNGQTTTTLVVMATHMGLHVLDFICTVFFTLELVVRFAVSPAKRKFVLNPMNAIDLLALVPLYVQVVFQQSELQACYMNERFVIRVMFILRIFRMFRIFHLVKHYQALKVLVYALKASLQELMMLFIFLLLAMLIFATMIYYAERGDEEKSELKTIPIGFWWAIVTMTMVGYGDVVPRTPVGYVVGTACSVVGVLLFALTFPIIANNFTLFYTHVRSRSISPRSKEEEDTPDINGDVDDVTVYEPGADCPPEPIDLGEGIKMRRIAQPRGAVRTTERDGDETETAPTDESQVNGAPRAVSPTDESQVNGAPRAVSSPAALGASSRPVSGQFVPIAKFSDTSSMNDIVFYAPTEDLLTMSMA